ncbi:MAG: SRPBCC family protein [Sphingomonadales bacterium]
MNKPTLDLKPGEARCPGRSVQDILDSDGDNPPSHYRLDGYRYLGSEDIPFDRYTSADFFQQELDRMWPRVWQWACREEHIPEVGDYYVYDVGPYSFIVVRTAPDTVKAYYNACLHRGTKLKASGPGGSSADITCPYHGWRWTLDGKLDRLLCDWDFPHVDVEEFNLPEVQVGLWGGFVFINMDENAPPLEEYLAPLPEHALRARLEDRYISLHIEKILPCNWKAAQEAFLEAYHVPETHPQLLRSSGGVNTQYDLLGPHLSRLYSPSASPGPMLDFPITEQQILEATTIGKTKNVDGFQVPEGSTARKALAEHFRKLLMERAGWDVSEYSVAEITDTVSYCAFPNGTFFLSISFPVVMRFRPLGMDHTKCVYDLILMSPVPKDGPRPEPYEAVRIGIEDSYTKVPGMDSYMGHVFDQDTMNMGRQQEGFMAAKKKTATLANYQEVRIRHTHQILDRYLAEPGEQG